jgi:hypothetical protein
MVFVADPALGVRNHGLHRDGICQPWRVRRAAILAVVWVIIRFGAKIEVTPTHVNVRVWMGYPRAARTLRTLRESARRDAIYAMHWYGGSLTFVNDGQWVLLGFPSAGWTRGQLLDLSEILGVCLYNHRTKHGWGKDAWDGQLMQRGDRTQVT